MTKVKKSIGTYGIPNNGVNCGVAYVIIPNDVDRDVFVRQCLLTSKIMIADGSGAVEKGVPVTKQAFRDLVFPMDSKSFGSQVFWNMIPKHSTRVVTGVFFGIDEIPDISIENEYRITKAKDGSIAEVKLDSDGLLNISVFGKKQGKGKLKISVNNPDKEALLDVYVRGKISVKTDKEISFLNANDLGVKIKEDLFYSGNTTKEYESATKAESLKDILGDLIKAIKAITVPTTNGPSGVPNNSVSFENVAQKLDNFIAKYNKIN